MPLSRPLTKGKSLSRLVGLMYYDEDIFLNEANVKDKVGVLLKKLGYYSPIDIKKDQRIELLKEGSSLSCDFAIYVNGTPRWVLKIKSSNVSTRNEEVVKDTGTYALNLGVLAFAVCNGKRFSLYKTKSGELLLDCKFSEFGKIKTWVSKESFKKRKGSVSQTLKGLINGKKNPKDKKKRIRIVSDLMDRFF